MRCCIYKSEQHKAIDCPLSWYRRPTSHRDAVPDEPVVDPAPDEPADDLPHSDGAVAGAVVSEDPAAPAPITPSVPDIGASSSSLSTSEQRLVNSQGLLISQPPPADLPERPATVMPFTQELSLAEDLSMSDSDSLGDEEDLNISDDDVDDGDVDTPADHSTPRSNADGIPFQESIPLAAAVKRLPIHKKSIGRRNPGKLSSSLSVPTRKPTTPLPVPSWKRNTAKSSAASSKSVDSANAPT